MYRVGQAGQPDRDSQRGICVCARPNCVKIQSIFFAEINGIKWKIKETRAAFWHWHEKHLIGVALACCLVALWMQMSVVSLQDPGCTNLMTGQWKLWPSCRSGRSYQASILVQPSWHLPHSRFSIKAKASSRTWLHDPAAAFTETKSDCY